MRGKGEVTRGEGEGRKEGREESVRRLWGEGGWGWKWEKFKGKREGRGK